MDHRQIEQNEIVERYVRHQLAADERLAFQEHYFACDQCFTQVQATAQFIAGVHDASRSGRFDAAPVTPVSSWFGWLNPSLAFAGAASLVLAALLLWLWLWKVPGYQAEIARERQTREESERKLEAARNQANESQRQLELERTERARLADQLQDLKPGERPDPDVIAQANIPTVTLESTRSGQNTGPELTIPSTARAAVLRIPVEPGNRLSGFRVQILSRTGGPTRTIDTRPNRSGTLTINVPSKSLQSGQYLVRLYGVVGKQTELLGEYDLRVVIK